MGSQRNACSTATWRVGMPQSRQASKNRLRICQFLVRNGNEQTLVQLQRLGHDPAQDAVF